MNWESEGADDAGGESLGDNLFANLISVILSRVSTYHRGFTSQNYYGRWPCRLCISFSLAFSVILPLKDNWRMKNKKQVTRGGSSTSSKDMEGHNMDIKSIMKDIEFLGSTHMTWKEKKELENKKVVSLGGKPPKKQRLPLSVAKVVMKKQKDRDEKVKQESMILGRFGSNHWKSPGKAVERHRPQDRVLKSTEGNFRNGVLDVKHLLQPSAPKISEDSKHINKGTKKKGSKKKHGKKGGGRRHR